jgi:hypothetical protein
VRGTLLASLASRNEEPRKAFAQASALTSFKAHRGALGLHFCCEGVNEGNKLQ